MNGESIFFEGAGPPLFSDATSIRAQLNIDDIADDALLMRFARVAQAYIEKRTGRPLTARTVTGTCFLASRQYNLIVAPLSSLNSVETVHPNSGASDVSDLFDVLHVYGLPVLSLKQGKDLVLPEGASIQVSAEAGYSAAPEPLVQAVLLLAGHYYRNREDSTNFPLAPIPAGVEALIGPYRLVVLR